MERHKNGTDAAPIRIGEDRAARILERAAALDATRSSEIELDQLRDAAAAAGISNEAFDQAMAEIDGAMDSQPQSHKGKQSYGRQSGSASSISSSDFAHFTAVLRDIMGDEGHVNLVEDRIEWQDKTGVTVSVSPTGRGTTTSVAVEGKLASRMLAVGIPLSISIVLSFMFALMEDELAIALVGFLLASPAFVWSAWWTHRREKRKLRKKADSIRRQLARLLVVDPPQEDAVSRVSRFFPRSDGSQQ